MVSPRTMSDRPKRYTNLLMKMRSSLTSAGVMLVPSTLTGWYRNRMTTMAITTLTERSRNQEIALRAVEGGGVTGGLIGGTLTAGAPCSSCIYHYYRRIYRLKVWGGWWDLNPRHPEPQSGATTN